MVRNVFTFEFFRPAGLSTQLETSLLIPNTNLRPADVLIQPVVLYPGDLSGRPTAYDITVQSPDTSRARNRAARSGGAATILRDADKLRSFDHALCENLALTDTASIPDVGFPFVPLVFDTLDTIAANSIWQKLSFAICSTVVAAILARIPALVDT